MTDAYKNVKVPLTYEGGELQVGFNYGGNLNPGQEREAVYIEFRQEYGSISVDSAITIRDKLTEIIEDYEAARPKQPSSRQFWEAANIGTVARNKNNSMIYTKISSRDISMVAVDDGEYSTDEIQYRDTYPGTAGNFEVLFEGVSGATV